jgi:hypothetical protein
MNLSVRWRPVRHSRLLCISGAWRAPSPHTPSIASALSSNNPAQIDQAIADIRAMLVGPTRFAAIENLKGRWLRRLITAERHDDAAELALAGR